MKSKLNIRRAVKEHGMTVAGLSRILNSSTSTLWQVINGNPTIEKLYSIAEAIGCDIIDLFYPIEEDITQETSEMDQEQPISEHKETEMEHTYICPRCGTRFQILE